MEIVQSEMKLLPHTNTTYEKYLVIASIVENLSIKDKRHIFKIFRDLPSEKINTSALFINYGMTVGEFAIFYVLGNKNCSKSAVSIK